MVNFCIPRKIFAWGRNNRQNFPGELTEAKLLGAKGTEKHIPKNWLFSPKTKVHLQNDYFSMQKVTL